MEEIPDSRGGNFDSFEDFEEFFIYCIHTNPLSHSKKEIGFQLGFTSPSALSLRLNQVDNGNMPRFNARDIWRYLMVYKDERIPAFLMYRLKKRIRMDGQKNGGGGVIEAIDRLEKELRELKKRIGEREDDF